MRLWHWASASETGSSAYLERKGVQGFGVRYGADGWLLVPLRDGDGRLWNVQRIAPVKPAKGTDKFWARVGANRACGMCWVIWQTLRWCWWLRAMPLRPACTWPRLAGGGGV